MENNVNIVNDNNNEEEEIDILELLEVLWSKALIIILIMVIGGAAAFAGTYLLVTPTYESSAMMYVNNSSIDVGSTKIDLSDLNASKSLAQTYSVILKSRTTLQSIIDRMNLEYDYKTLDKMIKTANVDNTEVFRVTVTSTDPDEAERIANCIVEVLPNRINSIMEGSNVKIVDTAVAEYKMVAPSYKKMTMIGAAAGFVLAAGIIIVRYLLDTTIHTDDYLLKEYAGIPLLTVVPLVDSDTDK